MPNLLKQLKRRTHWVSNNIIQTFQYIQNKSAEERYKVFKTIILCILFGCTDWLEIIENLFLELRWKWLADSLTDACGHVLGFRS